MGSIEEARFRAMGSDAHVVVVGGPAGALDAARRRIEELEGRWSRFRDDTEVARLNAGAGSRVDVSADTVLLVGKGIEAHRLTEGAVDPTLLGAVLRAGYDRSFEALDPDAAPGSDLRRGATEIEVGDGWVRLPAGVGFDPGGIGKGLAADLVTELLLDAGAAGCCANLGGDVRVAGDGPEGDGWTIAVEHPGQAEPIELLAVEAGAVATSTTLRRAWVQGGAPAHHLIDAATGRPSTSDLVLVAVVAADAWRAEVLAKAVLLRGGRRPFVALGPGGAEALAVDRAGTIVRTPGLVAYIRPR